MKAFVYLFCIYILKTTCLTWGVTLLAFLFIDLLFYFLTFKLEDYARLNNVTQIRMETHVSLCVFFTREYIV